MHLKTTQTLLLFLLATGISLHAFAGGSSVGGGGPQLVDPKTGKVLEQLVSEDVRPLDLNRDPIFISMVKPRLEHFGKYAPIVYQRLMETLSGSGKKWLIVNKIDHCQRTSKKLDRPELVPGVCQDDLEVRYSQEFLKTSPQSPEAIAYTHVHEMFRALAMEIKPYCSSSEQERDRCEEEIINMTNLVFRNPPATQEEITRELVRNRFFIEDKSVKLNKGPRSVEEWGTILTSDNPMYRSYSKSDLITAARELGRLGQPEAVPFLIAGLRKIDLGKTKANNHVSYEQSGGIEARIAMIESLGAIARKDSSAIEILEKIVNGKEMALDGFHGQRTRDAAKKALNAVHGKTDALAPPPPSEILNQGCTLPMRLSGKRSLFMWNPKIIGKYFDEISAPGTKNISEVPPAQILALQQIASDMPYCMMTDSIYTSQQIAIDTLVSLAARGSLPAYDALISTINNNKRRGSWVAQYAAKRVAQLKNLPKSRAFDPSALVQHPDEVVRAEITQWAGNLCKDYGKNRTPIPVMKMGMGFGVTECMSAEILAKDATHDQYKIVRDAGKKALDTMQIDEKTATGKLEILPLEFITEQFNVEQINQYIHSYPQGSSAVATQKAKKAADDALNQQVLSEKSVSGSARR